MNDQALRLRQLAAESVPAPTDLNGPPVIVIGSGKGGVGKSVLAVLTAQALADRGLRVLLLDGSQNLGHLQVLLGVAVQARLEQLARGEATPESLLHRVTERIWLVPGDSGAEGLYALPAVDSARLHHRLCALYDEFDAVVVDGGPGIEGVVRLSTMRGTRLVVVTMPEAGALTDAYALIKLVHVQLPTLPIDVLVNRVTSEEEATVAFERLAGAAERFLARSLGWLGALPETPELRAAMRRPGALLTDLHLAALRERVAALDLRIGGAERMEAVPVRHEESTS
jgi:flagellar biosynthesis protein FlhG